VQRKAEKSSVATRDISDNNTGEMKNSEVNAVSMFFIGGRVFLRSELRKLHILQILTLNSAPYFSKVNTNEKQWNCSFRIMSMRRARKYFFGRCVDAKHAGYVTNKTLNLYIHLFWSRIYICNK
jgi:hypothetical protein